MADPVVLPASSTANEAAVTAELDGLKSFRFLYFAPILIGTLMLFDSWDSIAVAYSMPAIAKTWHLNPLTMGIGISVGYAGQFAGAIGLGAVAERAGRMPVFVVAVLAMGALAIATALAPSYEAMLGIRFVQGLAIGGAMPIAITYVNELAPTATRGRYYALSQTIAMAGFTACSASGSYIIPHYGWRVLLGIGAFPLLFLPFLAFLPESPRWLARTGQLERANKALRKLGGSAVIFPDSGAQLAAQAPVPRPNTLLLFKPMYRARTILTTLLWGASLVVNFGIATWAPSIYTSVYHIPLSSALHYSAISSGTFLVLAPFVGFLMDKFGRKPFSMGGALISATCLLTLAALRPTDPLIVVGLVQLGNIAISISVLVLWPFTAESYPSTVRAMGVGWCVSIGRASSMITPLFVGFVLNAGAPVSAVFAMFGTCAAAAFLLWATRARETARTPLHTV